MRRAALADPRLAERAASLHEQVAGLIGGEVARGALTPGEPLPSERSLCDRLGVSRVTVRRALETLGREGLVVAEHGRGWFVAGEPIGEPPNVLLGFSDLAARRGLPASSDVHRATVRPATVEEAEALATAPGAPLFELERTRRLDGVALALDLSRVAVARAPDLPRVDFAAGSLYAVLAAAGAVPTRSEYTVRAAVARTREAALLGVDRGEPLLICEATTYDRSERPLELSEAAWIGARYRFRATLFGPGRAPGSRRTAGAGA